MEASKKLEEYEKINNFFFWFRKLGEGELKKMAFHIRLIIAVKEWEYIISIVTKSLIFNIFVALNSLVGENMTSIWIFGPLSMNVCCCKYSIEFFIFHTIIACNEQKSK